MNAILELAKLMFLKMKLYIFGSGNRNVFFDIVSLGDSSSCNPKIFTTYMFT